MAVTYVGKSRTIHEPCPVCGIDVEIRWTWKELPDGFKCEENVRINHQPFGPSCAGTESIAGYRTVGCCGICKYFSQGQYATTYGKCNEPDCNNIWVEGEIDRAMRRIYHPESWSHRPRGINTRVNGWCSSFRDRNDSRQ